MAKKVKHVIGIPYNSESNPVKISHWSGKITDISDFEEEILYEVKGDIYQEKTNTILPFCKLFGDIRDAEKYFNKMVELYPQSEVIFNKRTIKPIKIYV